MSKAKSSAFKEEKEDRDMAKRRKIRKKYFETREKTTKAGRRGTIIKKWKPKKKKKGFLEALFD